VSEILIRFWEIAQQHPLVNFLFGAMIVIAGVHAVILVKDRKYFAKDLKTRSSYRVRLGLSLCVVLGLAAYLYH
jgi:hypothetical protein